VKEVCADIVGIVINIDHGPVPPVVTTAVGKWNPISLKVVPSPQFTVPSGFGDAKFDIL
jgi:hypothetical protein